MNTLKSFDMNDQSVINHSVLIIGSRLSGKTTLVNDYLKHHSFTSIINTRDQHVIHQAVEKQRQERDLKNNIAIVVEDFDKSIMLTRDSDIRDIIFNGRFFNITLILTTQHVTNIPPELRANISQVFLLGNNSSEDKKQLYEKVGGMFELLTDFTEVYNHYTDDFGCLVFAMSAGNKIEDSVFNYKVW